MSLNDYEMSRLLEHHATAITTMTITNVEHLIHNLKGNEDPNTEYSRGYRDAIEIMLIRLRQLNSALEVRKPERPNE
jgi:hypothetical protein